ncbi:MAG: 1-(5-phosphoribosyl)-5-[(5-phosphoribosylamino)methylideneamino]imidazole-4-carboxamide isomerase [Proteobacteria bacterium]|nr:1-(5-phosphoribosyl)-5-[(5-phosphoribosylamino)methylideneamino]imidazole-4-carboxamide isomerase [Pseudomonadota bacterium]
MIIIPAIDLKGGQCVRLSQGDMDRATVYSENPAEMAKTWQSMGAQRIHVVDLNGAVSGQPKNRDAIIAIVSAVSVPVQLGGGIRGIETIKEYFSCGIDRVILGTAAIKDPLFLEESCRTWPGKIIVGIDATDGMVCVQGWTEKTAMSVVDLVKKIEHLPLAAIVFTDIKRDGMLTGPNIESTAQLARSTHIPVIASGGVSRIEDIEALLTVEQFGVSGVIIGRALYTGNLDLRECIRIAEGKRQ